MKWQFNKYLAMEEEQRQKRMSLRIVMVGGFIVFGLKGYAYLITFSNAILSDVFESMLNLVASGFSMYGLYFAGKPRDSKHPYGPGKMEFLTAAAEGLLIVCAGSFIFGKAIYNIIYPQGIDSIDKGAVFEGVGAVFNAALGIYLVKKAKKLDSQILNADGRRILTDAYSTIGLIAALMIIMVTKWNFLDNVVALVSGFLILRTGYKIIKMAIPGLLDRADTKILEEVVKVLQHNSRPAWIDIQNMRSSHFGMYIYIDCHITMPWYWNLKEVNTQVLDAELIINQHFKQRVDLFVQSEPCKPKDCHRCRMDDCPVRQFPYSGKSFFQETLT